MVFALAGSAPRTSLLALSRRMSATRPTPRPWPMKWVALVIFVFIAGYTFVNLKYRKPGKAHEPAADMRARVTAARLKEAGWEKLPLSTRRPVEKIGGPDAPVSRGILGLGLDFNNVLVEKPALLRSIDLVVAPGEVTAGTDYTVCFTATLHDQKYQLSDIQLYRRGNEIVLLPVVEHLPGNGLYSRWKDDNYCATFSTQALAPGTFTASLLATGPAAKWSFTVK
jgi:hypothetical protein